ncbi:V-type ATP synthase subunit F [Ruminococcaceae bacterium OttesenSCG-928-A16]|nr:V-type ATP synthase subunit F [Ruminococcaceae bacterium OttesenSCG-928-A16]
MYKIAAIGDKDSIYGFASVGMDIYPVDDGSNAARQLRNLAEGGYAVIYITEALYAQLGQEVDRYRELPLPAIIPIPGAVGNTGVGIAQVKKSVVQAVGSDIIFDDK